MRFPVSSLLAACLCGLSLSLSGCSDDQEASPNAQSATATSTANADATAPASTPVDLARGQEIYELYCQYCHAPGPGHPGAMMLSETRGADKAVIKGRSDLTVAYISTVVRNGLLEMAPFRPTEITDAELVSLAEYVRAP